MKDSTIFKKNKDIVTRTIDKETILMPLYKSSEEIDCIYTLNDVAARLWDLINDKRTLGQIKKIILKEFDTTETKMEKELATFLKDLQEIKAIK